MQVTLTTSVREAPAASSTALRSSKTWSGLDLHVSLTNNGSLSIYCHLTGGVDRATDLDGLREIEPIIPLPARVNLSACVPLLFFRGRVVPALLREDAHTLTFSGNSMMGSILRSTVTPSAALALDW